MIMTLVSSHRCLGSLMFRKKRFPAKEIYFPRGINLSRKKQNYRFYLFDKSRDFYDKHVI